MSGFSAKLKTKLPPPPQATEKLTETCEDSMPILFYYLHRMDFFIFLIAVMIF